MEVGHKDIGLPKEICMVSYHLLSDYFNLFYGFKNPFLTILLL